MPKHNFFSFAKTRENEKEVGQRDNNWIIEISEFGQFDSTTRKFIFSIYVRIND